MKRRHTTRRLIGLLRPFYAGILIAVLFGALTVLASVGLMATSAWLISRSALRPSVADLGVSIVGVRFFGIARGVFRYLERLAAHDTTFRLLAHLRVQFYAALEPLAPARLSAHRSGDLLSRVVNDVETLENVFLRGVAPFVVAGITGIATAILFAAFDPLAALILIGFMLVGGIGLPLWALRAGAQPGTERVAASAALNAALVDGIQGMADLVANGAARAQLAQLDALSERFTAAERHYAHLDSLQMAFGVALAQGAALAVLIAAIPRVEGIYLATLTLATLAAFEAITPLAAAAAQFSRDLAAADRLFEVADQPPAVTDPANPAPLPARADLYLDGVRLQYTPDGPPALDGLTLSVPAGARIAIVGASGAGKSSILNVLLRFWDYQDGKITVGGTDLRALSLEDARRLFAVMPQRPYLFNTTLRENIRIAYPEATDSDVEAAVRAAQATDFIAALPDGYETLIGENGAKLSAGQAGRVALARALLRPAPILILDEATANLDPVTERSILETVYAAAGGRTLIALTHRLALLDQMDVIYVMDGGRIVQAGHHTELIRIAGPYARLVEAQPLETFTP